MNSLGNSAGSPLASDTARRLLEMLRPQFTPLQVALFRASAKKQAIVETKIVPAANPKTGALTTTQVTGRAVSK